MNALAAIDPLYSLSGALVGLLVGQTGVGGGSLMTPLLILVFGVHPLTAVGTDLLFASATKTIGTLVHGHNKTVDWQIVVRLACGSIPATMLTCYAVSHFDLVGEQSSSIISVILGVALILSAVALIFRSRLLATVGARIESRSKARTTALTVLAGAILGFLVSISSVGAGALGVTALIVLYPRLPLVRIVGSDIAHAVPLTLIAGIGHWMLGSVNWQLLASLLTGSIPGIIVGSMLSARVPEWVLRPIMVVVLILVGGRMIM